MSDLPKKSLSELRTRFCNKWRRECTDEEFLAFVRDLTVPVERLGYGRKHVREHIGRMCLLSVGDEDYDISSDTLYRLTE